MATTPNPRLATLPLFAAFVLIVCGGIFLSNRAAAQARDTIRKHHLADIELALYVARDTHGTYPPYNLISWCGRLNDPAHHQVKTQVEQALRQQHEKYANAEKPFPTDPKHPRHDYFYWKHSPASFELFAILEQDPTGDRTTHACPDMPVQSYDYSLTSVWREPNE